MTNQNIATNSRLLRLHSVVSRVPLSKSEMYRRIKAGTFPAPIKIGVRAVAWREADIDQYISKLSKEQGHV